MLVKVRKTTKIRKRCNQVPHLTQDTTWKSNKNTINITNKSQELSPFPAGDHNAAMNRCKSMRNTRHKNINDPKKKYHLGTVSKNILLEGLNRFLGANISILFEYICLNVQLTHLQICQNNRVMLLLSCQPRVTETHYFVYNC